jgi:PAS domain S-box-containing protein
MIATGDSKAHTTPLETQLAVFRALAENAIDGVVMTDLDGILTYANRAAHELFGYDYSKQEMIGLHAAVGWPEDHVSFLQEVISPAIFAGGWRGEAPQKRKDGSVFTAQMSTFVLHDEQGQPIAAANILRDITARKQAEEERERLRQQIIDAQRQALQELSTPIIPIMDRIIVMPLIGSIDTMRSKDIMRALLRGISDYRARIVILDITGVPIVDSGVAGHLDKTIQAARLKGARTIITGVSDSVAETIVDLGIDWSGIETLRDLQSGLLAALNSLGIKLNM